MAAKTNNPAHIYFSYWSAGVRMVLSPVIILTLAFIINGCSSQQPAAAPFIPPQIETHVSTVGALSYTPPPLPNALEETPTSSIKQADSAAQTACSNSLRFIEDINYPDGTAVRQGEKIEKQWRVENNGTCSWDSRYRMRLVEGDQLGAPVELALFPARPGTLAELRVIFIAPLESRTYRSTWQAYGPDGLAFGDPFYIDIFVQSP